MSTTEIFKNTKDTQPIAAGEIIFSEGEAAGGVMYVIQSGEVDIFVKGELLDTIGEGAMLGELALIDDRTRTATAVAKTECRLVVIDEKRFTYLVQQHPFFALQVMKAMAHRLRMYRE